MNDQSVCIRFPGRGFIKPIGVLEADISHDYRTFGIDHTLLARLLRVTLALSQSRRVVLVPGGAGAFILSDLAQRLKLSRSDTKEIGLYVVAAHAKLIYRWFLANGNVECALIDHPTDVAKLFNNCRVVIVMPSSDFESTDALWGAATFHSVASHACILKHSSVFIERTDSAAGFHIDLQELLQDTRLLTKQGRSPLLDEQCISYLRRSNAEAWILESDCPEDIRRIVDRDKPLGRAKRLDFDGPTAK